MSSLPDADDVPGNLGILCADTSLESGEEEEEEEEEDFFDELRDWVWKDDDALRSACERGVWEECVCVYVCAWLVFATGM